MQFTEKKEELEKRQDQERYSRGASTIQIDSVNFDRNMKKSRKKSRKGGNLLKSSRKGAKQFKLRIKAFFGSKYLTFIFAFIILILSTIEIIFMIAFLAGKQKSRYDAKLKFLDRNLKKINEADNKFNSYRLDELKNDILLTQAVLKEKFASLGQRGIIHYLIFAFILILAVANIISFLRTEISIIINTLLLFFLGMYFFCLAYFAGNYRNGKQFAGTYDKLTSFFMTYIEALTFPLKTSTDIPEVKVSFKYSNQQKKEDKGDDVDDDNKDQDQKIEDEDADPILEDKDADPILEDKDKDQEIDHGVVKEEGEEEDTKKERQVEAQYFDENTGSNFDRTPVELLRRAATIALAFNIVKVVVVDFWILINVYNIANLQYHSKIQQKRYRNPLYNHDRRTGSNQNLNMDDDDDDDDFYLDNNRNGEFAALENSTSSSTSSSDERICEKTSCSSHSSSSMSPSISERRQGGEEGKGEKNNRYDKGDEDMEDAEMANVEYAVLNEIDLKAEKREFNTLHKDDEYSVMKYIALDMVDNDNADLTQFNAGMAMAMNPKGSLNPLQQNIILDLNNDDDVYNGDNDNNNANIEKKEGKVDVAAEALTKKASDSESKTKNVENINEQYEAKIRQMNELLER